MSNFNNEVMFQPGHHEQGYEENQSIKSLMYQTSKIIDQHLANMAGSVAVLIIISCIWLLSFTLAEGGLTTNSELFGLQLLLTTSLGCGLILKVFRLPSLLGMIVIGVVWRNWNVTQLNITSPLSTYWSGFLRNMATVIILLRGGYGLNHSILKTRWPVILGMSILPCLTECTVWAVLAYFLLQMPWLWGFLLGFVISAASAAVVIPMMLSFQEQGLGKEKGIPTIAIASTAIDNVLAMASFGILLSFIFSTGDLTTNLTKIPIQILVGISFGVGWGLLIGYVPRKNMRQGHLIGGRVVLLLSGGVIAVFGSKALDYQGAGPLACVIMAFLANVSWKVTSGWGQPLQPNPIADILSGLWIFLEAMLFVLIGTQIDVSKLNSRLIAYGLLVMFIAWVVRFVATILAVTGARLGLRENVVLAIAWLPKATVQAALGPVALETAKQLDADEPTKDLALLVLNLAALSILLTAPVGAVALQFCAPRLLSQAVRNAGESVEESNMSL